MQRRDITMNMIPDTFPAVFQVKQHFDSPTCTDIPGEVTAELSSLGIAEQVQPGQSVAITAGSRGVSNIARIIKAIADFFWELSAEPFIVPAMGSHGGGTAEGQRQVLASYGITEAFCGCPIRASMETEVIGEASRRISHFFRSPGLSCRSCRRMQSHQTAYEFLRKCAERFDENDDDWLGEKRRCIAIPSRHP